MSEVNENIETKSPYDIVSIREKFPILKQTVNGNPLVYLDNAATTQKPKQVIDTISWYYENINANVHRGVHHLSGIATDEYEKARDKARAFINAEKNSEIIFTRGVTEGINLVASSLAGSILYEGDEVIIGARVFLGRGHLEAQVPVDTGIPRRLTRRLPPQLPSVSPE